MKDTRHSGRNSIICASALILCVGVAVAEAETSYARVYSGKIENGIHNSLEELKVIALAQGTEEIIEFPSSSGPEWFTRRGIVQLGEEAVAYPGFTCILQKHFREAQQGGKLEQTKAGLFTETMPETGLQLQYNIPVSTSEASTCVVRQAGEVLGTYYVKPVGTLGERWPSIVRIDNPREGTSVIQFYEYVDSVSEEEFDPFLPPVCPVNEAELEPLDISAPKAEDADTVSWDGFWGIPSLGWDSGYLPSQSLGIRIAFGMGGNVQAAVDGDFELNGSSLCANNASGDWGIDAGVEFIASLVVDPVIIDPIYMDIPFVPNFDLRAYDTSSFYSYLLDSSSHVDDSIAKQEIFCVPIGIPEVLSADVCASASLSLSGDMTCDRIRTSSETWTSEYQCVPIAFSGGTYSQSAYYDENIGLSLSACVYPSAQITVFLIGSYTILEIPICWNNIFSGVPVDLDMGVSNLRVDKPLYDLSVQSQGASAVDISSNTGHEGTTPYIKTVESQTSVNLQAPEYMGSGASRKCFDGWSGSVSSSVRSITFTMDTVKSVVANYVTCPVTYTLSLSKGGSGGGQVRVDGTLRSLPWSGTFVADTSVSLEAVPASDSTFSNWSGDLSGSSSSTSITMSGNRNVTAVFNPVLYTLSLSKGGSGDGQVRVDGTLRSLPWSGTFNAGTSVSLEALPSNGSTFSNWSGDLSGSSSSTSITMSGNRNVTAVFNTVPYTLSLSKGGSGDGQVRVDGTLRSLPWSGTFTAGTSVSLEAVPATGSSFSSWSGDLTGSNSSTSITMSGSRNVTANFSGGPITLSLSKGGTGDGQVRVESTLRSLPWSGAFTAGASVELEAVPATGSTFSNWSGDLTGSSNPTSITMSGSRTVVVVFSTEPSMYHDADLNSDWRLVMGEVIPYITGWQTGTNPMAYAIRGAYLWQNGEYYQYDSSQTPPLCWVLDISKAATPASVVRSVAGSAVTISLTPPSGTTAWGVEEYIPSGLTVSDIRGSNGIWDSVNRKVSWWGTGFTAIALDYTVAGPAGSYALSGSANFDGVDVAVSGTSQIIIGESGAAVRSISGNAVTITLSPPSGTTAWGVEEYIPSELTVSDISGSNGVWDSVNGKISWWGTGSTATTLGYTVAGPAGSYTLSGSASFDGVDVPVSGTSQITIGESGAAVRSISGNAVTISLSPPSGTTAWGLEEYIPSELTVSNISGSNGVWDSVNRKVSWWGTGAAATAVGYSVSGPAGTYSLSGSANFDGVDVAVSGSTEIVLSGEEPFITIITPNGGEIWQPGTSQNITWTWSGDPGPYVKIELYGGGSFNSTITSSTSNDGTYTWSIASSQTVGSDYKVKITSTSNSAYSDMSNSSFAIDWANQLTVPDVLGLTQTAAEMAISAAGLSVGDISYQCNDDAPQGLVWIQDPAGGTEVAEGTLVNLVVSSGPCEVPEVTVEATDSSASESGGTGNFRISRSGSTSSSLSVYFSMSGSATNGSDYSSLSSPVTISAGSVYRDITLSPIDDSTVEGNETASLTISTNSSYDVGSPSSATITISDNDSSKPEVTVEATDSSASESGGTGNFTISRSGSTSSSLSVYFTMSGSATNGSDYSSISSPVTIPAGEYYIDITLYPVLDYIAEGNETATLTISTNSGYDRGSPYSATISIIEAGPYFLSDYWPFRTGNSWTWISYENPAATVSWTLVGEFTINGYKVFELLTETNWPAEESWAKFSASMAAVFPGTVSSKCESEVSTGYIAFVNNIWYSTESYESLASLPDTSSLYLWLPEVLPSEDLATVVQQGTLRELLPQDFPLTASDFPIGNHADCLSISLNAGSWPGVIFERNLGPIWWGGLVLIDFEEDEPPLGCFGR